MAQRSTTSSRCWAPSAGRRQAFDDNNQPTQPGRSMLMRRVGPAFALATGALVALASTALAGNVTLQLISSDPYSNATALDGVDVFHHTEEEPDTFAAGSTIVSTFQVARFHNGGAEHISWGASLGRGGSSARSFFSRDAPLSIPLLNACLTH